MTRRSLLACVVLLLATAPRAVAEPPRGSITIERISEIKYPTSPAWSPNGQMVAFLWDAAGKQDLFAVTPGSSPMQLTDFPADDDLLLSDIDSFAWASDDTILFGKEGRLWLVSISERKPSPFTGLSDAGRFTLSTDRSQLAFLRDGQIWIASVAAKTARQLTHLATPLVPSVPVFSADGRWLAFTASQPSIAPEELAWNGNLVRSMVNVTTDRRLGMISAHGGDVWWVPTIGTVSGVQWAASGTLVYQEVSPDGKTREIKAVSLGAVPRVLWRDHDERWWSPTARDARLLVSPDGQSVAFVSDRTGWIHVYVLPITVASDSRARQLTSGNFTAGLGAWSPDGTKIAYHHGAPGNQMERFVSIVDVSTGRNHPVVTARGVSFDPMFAPAGTHLLFQRTDVENSLDLYVTQVDGRQGFVRLSDSMPPGLTKSDLVAPVPVEFPSRADGKQVPATLMVPKNLDRTRKHPAIVWIHGSGQDQNFLGWHPGSYRMYYSASVYLAQQGYVILTPDYRGSSGYGREWTTGVHKALGLIDSDDVASGADYLKTLDYVDPERIGVWGLSYGGYLTLQTLTRDPTLWTCGINVAGVVDWATYPAGYTTPRLGTPVEHPEIYRESAPIYHMEKLIRPLLVLHGTFDRNVAFRDSLRLIDVLAKLNKPFEMGVYPGEVHFFRRKHVLRDAWRRVEEFFDRHLKGSVPVPTQ